MSGVQIRVAGRWLSHLAPWGDPVWSTRSPLGCWEASWTMLPGDWGVFADDHVDVFDGATCIWSGHLTQPDINTGAYTAEGGCRLTERVLALDVSGNVTGWPGLAMTRALSVGLDLNGYDDTPNVTAAILDPASLASGPVYLSALLDAWASGIGMRWRCDPDRFIRLAPDTSTPTWRLNAGVARIGMGSDFTNQLVVRYQASGGGYATLVVSRGSGATLREQALDLTSRGTMSSAAATDFADKALDLMASKPGLLDPVDVDASVLTTIGGHPAQVQRLAAGQMVRIPGVWDGPTPHVDVVIGEAVVRGSTNTATLTAIDTAPQDLESVIAKLQDKRR